MPDEQRLQGTCASCAELSIVEKVVVEVSGLVVPRSKKKLVNHTRCDTSSLLWRLSRPPSVIPGGACDTQWQNAPSPKREERVETTATHTCDTHGPKLSAECSNQTTPTTKKKTCGILICSPSAPELKRRPRSSPERRPRSCGAGVFFGGTAFSRNDW